MVARGTDSQLIVRKAHGHAEGVDGLRIGRLDDLHLLPGLLG
jgi:hypothetical protein